MREAVMQILIKLKSGHIVTLDDLREKNWSPKARKIMSWLAAIGIFGIVLFLLMMTP